jgi:hypothetical protein
VRKKITRQKGKGGSVELLPNRHALSKLTARNAFNNSINNYAKSTPSGANALDTPSVMEMAQVKY